MRISPEIRAFMQAWRLACNIEIQWSRTSEPTLGKRLTFGPRGILRLPIRTDVFLHAICVGGPSGCLARIFSRML